MRKFYAFFTLLLVCVIPFLKTDAQVNYLFTASQSIYTPLATGINPPLDNPTPTGYYEDDEGFANAVPLGFTFNFNNTNYTALNINVNGFVTFGSPFTMDVNDRYHTNNLTSGPKQDGIRPLIAPLWDDLRLQDNASLKYATQGTAPNRVFIVEWSNVSWNYNALAAAISFQMKLYEGSNAIEFVYQPLSGSASNASASIGIATCSLCTGSFLSVGSIENATSVSGITAYDDIKVKPIAGTVYRFEPGVCSMPVALSMDKYNTRTATFSWGAASANIVGYDYAVTTSPLQPLTYASTTNNNVTVASLQPGTQYYMHVRSSNLASKKSGWVAYTFKTACETTLPYKEGFENATAPKVPGCITVENPTGGNSWQISSMSNLPPYNNVITFSNDNNHQADGWFVLPAARLVGGNSYRIRFKYKVSDSAGINQKMEIRLGSELNATFAGWNTVYKNTKLNETIFKDTSALFAPQVDGIYFIAFRCNSDKNTATLLIDDIEMSAVVPSPVKILSFNGSRSDTKNVLVWRTSSEINNKGFELQKGADGINFSTIAFVNSKGINGNSTVTLDYTQIDAQPFKGNTYYRLRIVDANSNEFYSQPIVVKAAISLEVEYSRVFPNPVKDIVTAVVAAPINTRGNFVIADMYGKVLVNMPVNVVKGDNVFKVDVSSLRNGVYMSKLVCLTGQQTEARTFIKQ